MSLVAVIRSFSSSLSSGCIGWRTSLQGFNTTLLPMKFGVKGIFVRGRVFSGQDYADEWYNSYDFGVYLVPLTESSAITMSAGFTDEESALLQITIGSTFR